MKTKPRREPVGEFKVVISRLKRPLHVERIADELERVAGYLRCEAAVLTESHSADGYVVTAEKTARLKRRRQ